MSSNNILKVRYGPYHPFVSTCAKLPHLRESRDCRLPGMFVEVSLIYKQNFISSFQFLQILATHLNLTIQADRYHVSEKFSTNFEMIANGSIDLFSATFDNDTSYDHKLLELSIPIYYVS